MGNEGTQPEATKKKTNVFDSRASTVGCEALWSVLKRGPKYHYSKPTKETISFCSRTSPFGGEALWSALKQATK